MLQVSVASAGEIYPNQHWLLGCDFNCRISNLGNVRYCSAGDVTMPGSGSKPRKILETFMKQIVYEL